ncbi:MAG: molybdopterin molybdotransferase MoeA [Rhodospirillales bacterium]|nr:molybdopterin molybdotransferase MoeA [Rhodospirillales bacterium]
MNAISPSFGCTAGGLPFRDALARVLALAEGWLGAEEVPLDACAGRIAAAPFAARLDLPGFDRSAMDGYAVRTADLTPGMGLPVTGRTAAGDPPGRLTPGTAHRILTGAALPKGADAVVAQEHVLRECGTVCITDVPSPGTNIRRRREDIAAGQRLIEKGTRLDWRHVAVLAAQGARSILVRRRPRVALLSSGRELSRSGKRPAPGQIHDSNLPMLTALLHAWGADVRPCPLVPDDIAAMRAALGTAAEGADLVLTTAGISVGDEDNVRAALRDLGGSLAVLQVAMKPGKPLAAGRLGDAVFIGLPGNPQAALAGAVGFVRPLLARMAGCDVPRPVTVRTGFALRRKPGRTEFIPVRLTVCDGCLRVERTGPDGSGRLLPLLAATGFALIPEDVAVVQERDLLAVLPFVAGGPAH